ncbi:response regulator [Cerasicoccus frondis]|uniref:response regulator n=1 Tax=Cerasicoccus frondis TaxID=490090 RepID=UPI002852D4F3|nr:response regulator [Cerasicoccus frondis]
MNPPYILVVEDNPTLCDMIRRRLERRGYTAACAKDGQAGLETAIATKPDLILLDMSLPIMDGWTVAKALRKNKATRDIPTIAITAHAMRGDRERALGAGCHEFETKPIDFDQLQTKINMFLPQPNDEISE